MMAKFVKFSSESWTLHLIVSSYLGNFARDSAACLDEHGINLSSCSVQLFTSDTLLALLLKNVCFVPLPGLNPLKFEVVDLICLRLLYVLSSRT